MTKAVFRRYSTKETYNQQKEAGNIPDGAIFFIFDTKQIGNRKGDSYLLVSAENSEDRITILESLIEKIQSDVTILDEELDQFKIDINQSIIDLQTSVNQDLNDLQINITNDIIPKINKVSNDLAEEITNRIETDKKVEAIELDIVDIKEDIALLQGNEGTVNGIVNRVTTLENNYNDLEPRITQLEVDFAGQNSKLETRIRRNA